VRTGRYAAVVLLLTTLIISPNVLLHAQGDGSQSRPGIFGNLGAEVESNVLQQLRPYFPKARAKLDREGSLIILTCLRNAGRSMLKQIQPVIESQFYSTGLLNKLGLALSRTKRVDVGFEQDVLVFDLSSHHDGWIRAENIPSYVDAYTAICK
jgi:hypothetical protein